MRRCFTHLWNKETFHTITNDINIVFSNCLQFFHLGCYIGWKSDHICQLHKKSFSKDFGTRACNGYQVMQMVPQPSQIFDIIKFITLKSHNSPYACYKHQLDIMLISLQQYIKSIFMQNKVSHFPAKHLGICPIK